jgi:hypothetical protein
MRRDDDEATLVGDELVDWNAERDHPAGRQLRAVLLVLLPQARERMLPLGPLVEHCRHSLQPHPPKPRPFLLVLVDEHGDLRTATFSLVAGASTASASASRRPPSRERLLEGEASAT